MKNKTIINIAVATMISCPAIAATGIGVSAESANCDNGVLGTYEGESTLQAQWNANTINLDFYDGEDKISSGQCTYDGAIELPNEPTKEGYEFDGWKVRRASAPSQPQQTSFDLSTWDYGTVPNWDADYIAWKPFDENGDTVASALEREDIDSGTDHSASLSTGEWSVTFGNGTVRGTATCSTTSGDNHGFQWGGNSADWSLSSDVLQAGQYTRANGSRMKYCWCKPTDVDMGSGYQSVGSYSWVFYVSHTYGAASCASTCARDCARAIQERGYFRAALFGTVQ